LEKLDSGAPEEKRGNAKFLSLLRTYFNNGGYHVQINLLNKETLLDAKAHPENYRDLIVRVA
jgi:formate C-acetyltransferase